MEQTENVAPEKKPYSKPEVARFPLRPEEAVLANCKTLGGSGPGLGGPNNCAPATVACSVIAS